MTQFTKQLLAWWLITILTLPAAAIAQVRPDTRQIEIPTPYARASLPSTGFFSRLTDGVRGLCYRYTGSSWVCYGDHMIDIREFGAVVGDTGNQTTVIQAALDAAGKTPVLVPAGFTFKLGSQLLLNSDQHVIVAGTLHPDPAAFPAGQGVFKIDAKTNVRIEFRGGVLDGDKATNPSGGIYGIMVCDVSRDITIDGHGTIKNFPGTDASGTNGGDGIYIGYCGNNNQPSYVTIGPGLRLTGNVRQGLTVTNGHHIYNYATIDGTTGTNPGAGIDIEPNSSAESVYGFYNFGRIENNTGFGIKVDGGSLANGNVRDIYVHGVLTGNGALNRADLYITQAQDVHVSALFPNIKWAGVQMIVARNVTITNSGFTGSNTGSAGWGFGIISRQVDGLTIVGNRCQNTENSFIQIQPDVNSTNADKVTISSNKSYNCVDSDVNSGQPVINLETNDATRHILNATIKDNKLWDDRGSTKYPQTGIRAQLNDATDLRGWHVKDNYETGMQFATFAPLDQTKSTDILPLGTATGETGQICLRELAANGINKGCLKPPDSLTGDRVYTAPDADATLVQPDSGAANNFLTAISAAGAISKAQPTLSNLSDWLAPVRVSTQFDKAANTTLADVTGLSVALAASTTYGFRAVLFVDGDATGGHKYAAAYSGSVTAIIFQINSVRNDTNALVITSRQTASGGNAGAAGGTAFQTVIEGTITANGTGNLTVQFAQNAASGTSSVLVNSRLEAWKIP